MHSVNDPASHIYVSHYLANSAKRTANSIVGVVHAVQRQRGDNFSVSMCGKKPRPKSMGWAETSREITCPECKKMLSNMENPS